MKKFFLKLGALLLLIGIVLLAVFRVRYSGYNSQFVPLNHLSNSICYNGNFQNLAQNAALKDEEFLVMGSSMSLNNVSGEMIGDSFHCKAYNLSSWGFRSDKLIDFFKTVPLPSCKKVVVAFNNIDFGINYGAHYDFPLTNRYISGGAFDKWLAFVRTFNFLEFDRTFVERKISMPRNDKYFALGYDRYGSILLDTAHFKIDQYRYFSYTDTAGFDVFYHNVQLLKKQLDERGIRLYLVYLPYRRDLLTTERKNQNDYVAAQMRTVLPDNFIDLHSVGFRKELYADAAHFFRQGAEALTSTIIDSLKR